MYSKRVQVKSQLTIVCPPNPRSKREVTEVFQTSRSAYAAFLDIPASVIMHQVLATHTGGGLRMPAEIIRVTFQRLTAFPPAAVCLEENDNARRHFTQRENREGDIVRLECTAGLRSRKIGRQLYLASDLQPC